ncbi:hypothetical protein [Bacillus cereus]|uniref:hypothetical protein n=1 Tax=Bacillus cereus TaxID=1396 RepID=UPI003C7211C1
MTVSEMASTVGKSRYGAFTIHHNEANCRKGVHIYEGNNEVRTKRANPNEALRQQNTRNVYRKSQKLEIVIEFNDCRSLKNY